MKSRQTRVPSYRRHKPSGQAVVTLNGRDCYLGPFGTDASKQEYDRIVGEWQANGRTLPHDVRGPSGLLINELILAYWEFAETYYRKNGEPTTELGSIREALRPLKRLYGSTAASDFGPRSLKACREAMISTKLARSVINNRVSRIKRMYKWATENELVPPSAYHGLQAVASLKKDRSAARETLPVGPAPEEHIAAVLPLLPRQLQAMVNLQLLTGMRPGEVRLMRACDLDTRDKVWTYTPVSHKTEHFGRSRVVVLGPRAQAIIQPFFKADVSAYLFSPKDAEADRSKERRRKRHTPMTPSQAARKPKRNRRRAPREHFDKNSYGGAIRRACEKAEVPQWHPHQLRHNAATRFRREGGLEEAQILLGHKYADVTQIYAERDQERATRLIARIG